MSKAYFVILHQKTSIMKIGFDNEKYQKIQSEHIKERISQFDGKLYLELEANFSMIIMPVVCCRDSCPTASCACSKS